jgi:hypothetical protein
MSVDFEKLKFVLDVRFLEIIDDVKIKRKQSDLADDLKYWRDNIKDCASRLIRAADIEKLFNDEKVGRKDFDECSVISTTFSSSELKDKESLADSVVISENNKEDNNKETIQDNDNDKIQQLEKEISRITENNKKLHKFNRNLKAKVERCYQIISIKSEEIMRRGRLLKSLNLNENFLIFFNELQKREKIIADNLKEIRRKEKVIIQYRGNEKHYQNLTADCTRKINLLKEKIENLGFKIKEDKLHQWKIIKLNEETVKLNKVCKEIVEENTVNKDESNFKRKEIPKENKENKEAAKQKVEVKEVNKVKEVVQKEVAKQYKNKTDQLNLKENQLKQKEEEINKREQELINAKNQEEKYVTNLMDKLTKEIY